MRIRLFMITLGIAGMLHLVSCGGEQSGSFDSASPSSPSSSSSKGGSTARFTIADNFLYTISGSKIQVYNIEDSGNPKFFSQMDVYGNILGNIETLFAYNKKLFVGSTSGVFIYDITDPAFPQYKSQFTHLRSCDPVVVQGDYAYVTLRNTTQCRGGTVN